MSNYTSENTHILATCEQAGGNTRMLLFHVCDSGRHEYVVGSYFTVNERPADEGWKEYEWYWGHYFQSIVDAVDYWQREVAADLLDGFEIHSRERSGFWMEELPLASIDDSASTRYVVKNEYTGELYEGLDRYDVEEMLEKWLTEDGYEWSDEENWQSYRWADYAPGYIVYVSEK